MAGTAVPPEAPVLERVLRRERVLVSMLLGIVVVSSWLYLLSGAGMSDAAPGMTPASQHQSALVAATAVATNWSPAHALVMFWMWWVMMIGMMLPSATPMILLFAAVNRKQRQRESVHVPTSLFAGAYLAAWGGFSLGAVIVQWGLQALGWLSPMLESRSATLSAVLLIVAGVYQLTPLKQACLRHCRTPLQFISTRWRPGYAGAFRMGVSHGAYCVGCCWPLMGLLFVGGVMNPWWILGLSVFVLVEKAIPAGHWLGQGVGVLLVAAGTWLLG